MEEFATHEAAVRLFQRDDFISDDNRIFIAHKDTTRDGIKYGAMGAFGAAGAILLSGIVDGMDRKFDSLLINPTSTGLGIIPLNCKGVAMTINPSKMAADPNGFTFISYDNIESITLKNYNIFNSRVKKLKIKIKKGKTLHLMVNVREKLIAYHEDNFAAFMEKYQS